VAQSDLRRVQRAARKVNKAREELAQAVLAAQESGESLRDIAPYAGLSYSRVYELVREARKREGD
jgi:DNA-directed RNA polymerase specialized sigma24 family protein